MVALCLLWEDMGTLWTAYLELDQDPGFLYPGLEKPNHITGEKEPKKGGGNKVNWLDLRLDAPRSGSC